MSNWSTIGTPVADPIVDGGIWTFTNSESDLDQVRDLIGDTNPSHPFLPDVSITRAINSTTSLLFAAARCAMKISAKYSGRVNKSIGGRSISNSSLSTQFAALATSLRSEARRESVRLAMGGISRVSRTVVYPTALEHSDLDSDFTALEDPATVINDF